MTKEEQLFHRLWAQAKDSPSYNKKEWMEFQTILDKLSSYSAHPEGSLYHRFGAFEHKHYEDADLVIGDYKDVGHCILKNNHGHINTGRLSWLDTQRYIAQQPAGALVLLLKEK